jgi:hypothetical protein
MPTVCRNVSAHERRDGESGVNKNLSAEKLQSAFSPDQRLQDGCSGLMLIGLKAHIQVDG